MAWSIFPLLPYVLGQLGWRSPVFVERQAPPMTATAAFKVPAVDIGMTVAAPRALATATMLPPAAELAVLAAPPPMAATALMQTPTVSVGQSVVVPPMTAIAAALAPALSAGASLVVPTMQGSAQILIPTADVFTAIAILPPAMLAQAQLLVPTVGAGQSVSAPLMLASALMLPPTAAAAQSVTLPSMSASAAMKVPTAGAGATVVPLPITAAAAMNVPTYQVGQSLSPPLMAASALMRVPTVNSGVAVTPPALAAAAAMLAPNLGINYPVTPPVMSATAAMVAPTAAWTPDGPAPLQFIGSATGTNTATTPAHQTGDLIIVAAFNDASTTAVTTPAGYPMDFTTTTGTTCSMKTAGKLALSNAETVGTWTNATRVVVAVYRCTDGIAGFLPTAASGSSTAIGYPVVPSYSFLGPTSGSYGSWYIRIGAHRTATNMTANTQAGYTDRTPAGSGDVRIMDTNGPVFAAAAAYSQTVNANSGWIAANIEILPVTRVSPFTDTFSSTFDTAMWQAFATSTGVSTGTATVTGGVLRLTNSSTTTTVNCQTKHGFRMDEGLSREAVVQLVQGAHANQQWAIYFGVYQPHILAASTMPNGNTNPLQYGLVLHGNTSVSPTVNVRKSDANGASVLVTPAAAHSQAAGDYYRFYENSSGLWNVDWAPSANPTSWTNMVLNEPIVGLKAGRIGICMRNTATASTTRDFDNISAGV